MFIKRSKGLIHTLPEKMQGRNKLSFLSEHKQEKIKQKIENEEESFTRSP